MSTQRPDTRFISRGRLDGLFRARPSGGGPDRTGDPARARAAAVDELDTQLSKLSTTGPA